MVKYPFYIRMRCVQNRWGTGSCSSERPTGGSLEQQKNLQAMLAERAKQDAKWSKATAESQATAEPEPIKYTSAAPKGQSQAPSSSERDRYASFLQ